jgi:hypothetical protein
MAEREVSSGRSHSLSWMGEELDFHRLDGSGHAMRGTSAVLAPTLLRKVGEVDYGRSASGAGDV